MTPPEIVLLVAIIISCFISCLFLSNTFKAKRDKKPRTKHRTNQGNY